MVFKCCADGCPNAQGRDPVSFYRLPANPEHREKWVAAIRRAGWRPTPWSRLCSAHFVKGKRDFNPLSPDFVPSIFNHTSIQDKKRRIKAVENFDKRLAVKRKRREAETRAAAAKTVVGLAVSSTEDIAILQGENSGKRDLNPLLPDFVQSLFSHMSTQEQKQRMRAMAVSESRETTKRRRLAAKHKAAAAKALTTSGVRSVEGFGNTSSTTVQDGNACQYPLNGFIVDVQDPNMTTASVKSENVNNSSGSFVRSVLDPNLTMASVRSENVNNPSDSFVSNVLDPNLTTGSVTSKNVNNPSDSFVNSVLDPDLTIASVKSETVSSPSDGLGQALNINSSISVKSEISIEEHDFDFDSCITVKLENTVTQSENFVNSIELQNMINPSVTLLEKAQNADSRMMTDRSTMTDMHDSYVKSLKLECQALRSKCHDLEDKKNRLLLSEETFQNNDAKVRYYTGLPTFEILMGTFGIISDYLQDQLNLTKFQQYIMTLMHIRLNRSMQDLAYRFDVSGSTASRIFHDVIHVCMTRLVPALVFWPERENTKHNLPVALKNEFPQCTAIINCLELPIEISSNTMIRKQTRTRWKGHTMKYLVAVSPQGLISYVSKGWGGRYSNKHIAEHCGILQKITPGDEILADKGFNKGTGVGLYGASLTEGKKELCMINVEKTKNMAEVQSYVEKVMGVVHAARQKYVMLQSTVSISLLEEFANNGLTVLDKVVCVACALSSVSESLMAKS